MMRRRSATPSPEVPRGTESGQSEGTIECRVYLTKAIPTPGQQLAWRRLWERLLREEPPPIAPGDCRDKEQVSRDGTLSQNRSSDLE
jgi:hypothetical protein